MIDSVTILSLSLLSKHKPIAHPTTPLQHIRILRRIITLTRNIRTAQLEVSRQRSLASPLNVVVIVVRASIGAAHDIYIVETPCIATCALQLWDWRTATSASFLAGAKSQAGDFGEEDAVGGFAEGVG
jgi:hypothetical protein